MSSELHNSDTITRICSSVSGQLLQGIQIDMARSRILGNSGIQGISTDQGGTPSPRSSGLDHNGNDSSQGHFLSNQALATSKNIKGVQSASSYGLEHRNHNSSYYDDKMVLGYEGNSMADFALTNSPSNLPSVSYSVPNDSTADSIIYSPK